jgi:hypothetical protein
MAKRKAESLGNQPPRHRFFLNPYEDVRFTRCPKCRGKTRQRKLPLVIHVDPMNLVVLNKTCRYCPYCDLLIAHQDEIEAFLAAYYTAIDPSAVGNDYHVVGTLDRADWRRGTRQQMDPQEMLECLHEFKDVLEFELGGGWGPA